MTRNPGDKLLWVRG